MKTREYPFFIESLVIGNSGDMSVGIHPESYEVQVCIEVNDDDDIEQWRKKFTELWSEFCESPKCVFDFEIKEQDEEPAIDDSVDHTHGLPGYTEDVAP
jgi:hypothetical protein